MTTDEEYRKQATEAQRMADRAKSPLDREAWLRIAQSWMALVRGGPKTASEQFDAQLNERGTRQKDSSESH